MNALLRIGTLTIGGTIFAATAYVTAISYAPAPAYTVTDSDRERTWEEIAGTYYEQTKNQEFYLGIRNMRRAMVKEARGDVLEVGAGTGTMVGMYPACEFAEDEPARLEAQARLKRRHELAVEKGMLRTADPMPFNETDIAGDPSNKAVRVPGVRSVTMSDRATNMLTQLEDKIQGRIGYRPHRINEDEAAASWFAGKQTPPDTPEEYNKAVIATNKGVNGEKHPLYQTAHFASESIPFPDSSFDTVVDVFGLCSYDDPVKALTEMSRVCKPDGRLLLLEHGRGTWSRVNMQLDKWAPRHAKSWGCWWNRDMRRYLRLAGLTVEKREEKHFGTTMRLCVKPNKKWLVGDKSTSTNQ